MQTGRAASKVRCDSQLQEFAGRVKETGGNNAWNYFDRHSDYGAAGSSAPVVAQPGVGLCTDWWSRADNRRRRNSAAAWPDLILERFYSPSDCSLPLR